MGLSDMMKVKTEEEVLAHKPIKIFGRDVLEIKCFRNTFLCGICSGVAGGLACFLGTSKTLFSTHVGFASLWIGVFAYWIPCRYSFESKYLAMESYKQKRSAETETETEENAS